MVYTGLDSLVDDKDLQKTFKGNVALLCHNASIDRFCRHGAMIFKNLFGKRFVKLFGPQHGFATDVQDNMIKSDHFIHPFFGIPVYSLYSETRIPTDEMLDGIDHFFIDLQDIGCRMYTYIYTLTYILEACADKDIQVIVLDRPNPINGQDIEGNILESEFKSFIGLHPIPVRHGLTIGEVALMHQKHWTKIQCQLKIIPMQGWKRQMDFEDTKLPWALPSPNIPRPETSFIFPATVLFEGSNLSEGRGTTQSLEIIGHPRIKPFAWIEQIEEGIQSKGLKGVQIRPITFLPTFQKHADKTCGGFQIHITNRKLFTPWKFGQVLLQLLYHQMGESFQWKNPPYEYNYDLMPIDIINGTDKLRNWVVNKGSMDELKQFEKLEEYKLLHQDISIY